ncbi:MAG: hypothetical protein MI748_00065 [Opitutales bacterium]|nr:hypothetical protein [Opitutales bacterium]
MDALINQLTDEAFLKPAALILSLLMFLLLLKRINKILLFVGLAVIGALVLLNNQPAWLQKITDNFKW